MTLREKTIRAAIETLQKNNGHRTRTAEELNICIRTMRNYIKIARENYGLIEETKTKLASPNDTAETAKIVHEKLSAAPSPCDSCGAEHASIRKG